MNGLYYTLLFVILRDTLRQSGRYLRLYTVAARTLPDSSRLASVQRLEACPDYLLPSTLSPPTVEVDRWTERTGQEGRGNQGDEGNKGTPFAGLLMCQRGG
ncbi:hypothetical protein KQX54_006763 [Cotesia glomerata]|uniref:Secreted protein n=1 Tax=Cotesia glomerata TaxID=32391 RepID=A0AAV7IBN0_COTGL|nr:hypothetical protein KQX54_006763 [Cotesia glomerata]